MMYGGREQVRHLVVDVQTLSRRLSHRGQVDVEQAAVGTTMTRAVSTSALAVPTTEALSMYDARSWPASFVEFWLGDGAPNLERSRPMLFEEVARMLVEREELEYQVDGDAFEYHARYPSRFVSPDIIACLGDATRRLALLQGTRAVMARRGFGADLKEVSQASSSDIMEAAGLPKPPDCMLDALRRKDISASLKTALRSVLLSTSNVPGTEGRKVSQRHLGHAMNLWFGPSVAFITPNFADKYQRLMVDLHEGPGSGVVAQHDERLRGEVAAQEDTGPVPMM